MRRLVIVAALAAGLCWAALALAADGDITTVAGTGTQGFGGDGGPATAAQLSYPFGVAMTPDGGYLIADTLNHRVRRVSPGGTITTVAGTGIPGSGGDGGPATSAQVFAPTGVAVLADGSFLIADRENDRVRQVSLGGTITTVAGTGVAGNSGDGGPATAAKLDTPSDVDALPGGGFLIADSGGPVVRQVSSAGVISTVAGQGEFDGSSGDGGPATSAQLDRPTGVAALPGGGFLIADPDTDRVRRVSAGGTISTVAGTGTAGFSGDGGPATSAQLHDPYAVAVMADGGFVISDSGSNRVRRVSADGTISTVAGTGPSGFGGDGGPATSAQLNEVSGVAATADGGFLVADLGNHRVRRVAGVTVPAPSPPSPLPAPAPPSPVPPPSPAPSVSFGGSPKTVTVGRTGSFRYRFRATPAARGTLKLTSAKKLRLGTSRRKRAISLSRAFTAPATGRVSVTVKLDRARLGALRRAKRLGFSVSVRLAGRSFTTKVTLKAPAKRKGKR